MASYPKSGNTWLKMMLASIICDEDTSFDKAEELLPSIGHPRPNHAYLDGGGIIIKTHERHRRDYKKAVYLVRDGRDVYVSYYHFYLRSGVDYGSLQNFVRRHLDSGIDVYGPWHKHVQEWIDASRNNPDILIAKYEDLRSNTLSEMQRICDHLRLPHSAENIQTAITRNALKKMQNKEYSSTTVNAGRQRDIPFARKGAIGEWRECFPDELATAFRDRARAVLQQLEYPLD